MTKSWVPSEIQVDESELRKTVERILETELGTSLGVTSFRREPCSFSTLFPADVLSVTLTSGHRLRLFLKHLGCEESEHPDKLGPEREIKVYTRLFRGNDLPVPKVYGCKWNNLSERHELFLEYLDDWTLQYHHLEHWFTAAKSLAHLHLYFADREEKLRSCDFLNRFDQDYFTLWADRALTVVSRRAAELRKRLKTIIGDYGRVASLLAQQPETLVHNDLSPKNVIACASVDPARICFIDWEMAGVGCCLLDLVHLKYGLDEECDKRMCRAYLEAVGETGLVPSDQNELERLFLACELHRSLYRLAHSDVWELPSARITQFVDESEDFVHRIQRTENQRHNL